MRTLRFLLQKEFRQIFRDKNLLRQILMVPIIQLLIFPWAANYEVKNISLAIVDHDHSSYSEKFISKINYRVKKFKRSPIHSLDRLFGDY